MAALTWIVAFVAGVACVSGLGTEISIEEYPSVVQIEDRVGTLWLQQCAGSVLTSYHVLSTAGCFIGDAERRVRGGTAERSVGGQVREVYSVHNHPSYGTLGKEGDLTIIRLQSNLPLGATIAQVAIIGQGIELPKDYQMGVVGWGTTAEGGLFGDSKLYQADLNHIENDECMEKYLVYNGETVTENMVCAGLLTTRGRDLDSRDAGAPVYIQDAITRDITAVGVISFGVSRSNDDMPIVATYIGSYTSWIVETASSV